MKALQKVFSLKGCKTAQRGQERICRKVSVHFHSRPHQSSPISFIEPRGPYVVQTGGKSLWLQPVETMCMKMLSEMCVCGGLSFSFG